MAVETFPADGDRDLSSVRGAFHLGALSYLLRGHFRAPAGHLASSGHRVPPDFSAICVASQADPASDTYIVERLRELGLRHVRLDYGYCAPGGHTERFLRRLLQEDFAVLLHLVQPPEEAARMGLPDARQRWRDFVAGTLERWGHGLEAVEIGNTVNRRRWCGYHRLEFFASAWQIAAGEVQRRGLRLAGPNITDFEPPYNVGLLKALRRCGGLPEIHTTNLFAERATEPENYDRKILGRRFAHLHQLNLVKKARLLAAISERFQLAHTWSTTAFWTLGRIRRMLEDCEQKQADYLARYMLLAAASGALGRAYWGPLVSWREGLIDDGSGRAAPHELVSFYGTNYGELQNYRTRPAFDALAFFNRAVPGAEYRGQLCDSRRLQLHEFVRGDQRIHAVWTVNGCAADLMTIYSREDLARAGWRDRDGAPLAEMPEVAGEAPLYLTWPAAVEPAVNRAARVFAGARIAPHADAGNYYCFDDGQWRGMVCAASRADADKLFAGLHPHKLPAPAKQDALRKTRNAVWKVADPRDPEKSLVVKKPDRLPWNKKLADRFKPSKGLRSWNGAVELQRIGVATPRPVAWFERIERGAPTENWYICEFQPGNLSVRDFFSAFKQGANCHRGVAKREFLQKLAQFLLKLHKRGAYFRDLSGGNMLVRLDENSEPHFSLIDTGRARFYPKQLTVSKRLSDLKRACYKLDWQSRKEFMALYLGALGRRFTALHRLPFLYYDLKIGLKRRLKGKKKS